MAVPEQTPYIEHTGNGVTTSFSLGFQCESKDHLIVLVDEIEPPIATWSLTGGNVVFTTAPATGKKITLQRNTPFGRTTDYQSFNNSFRPQSVNGDFDRLWLKLQELGVGDWLLKLYVDRLHREQKEYIDQKDDELKNYLIEEIRKQGVALDQLEDYYNYLMQRLAQIAVDKGWDAAFVVDASGDNQQQINDRGGAYWREKSLGYDVGYRVMLNSGDIVKSIIPNNTINPNLDMYGWINTGNTTLLKSSYFGITGTADETLKVQALVDYVNNNDNVSKVSIDSDITSSQLMTFNRGIEIDFKGHTFNCTFEGAKFTAGVFFKGVVDTDTYATLVVDNAPLSNKFTVNNASIFAVGDYVSATYNRSVVASAPYASEDIIFTAKILSIAGNDLYLDHSHGFGVPIVKPWGTAAGPSPGTQLDICKSYPIFNPKVKGFNFSNGIESATTRLNAATFYICIDAELSDVTATGIGGQVLHNIGCRGTTTKNLSTVNPRATTGGRGYVIQENGSHDSEHDNLTGINDRHTHDASTMSSRIKVKNSRGIGSANYSFGCHSTYIYDVTIENCDGSGGFHYGNSNTGNPTDGYFGSATGEITLKNVASSGTLAKIYLSPLVSTGLNRIENCKIPNTVEAYGVRISANTIVKDSDFNTRLRVNKHQAYSKATVLNNTNLTVLEGGSTDTVGKPDITVVGGSITTAQAIGKLRLCDGASIVNNASSNLLGVDDFTIDGGAIEVTGATSDLSLNADTFISESTKVTVGRNFRVLGGNIVINSRDVAANVIFNNANPVRLTVTGGYIRTLDMAGGGANCKLQISNSEINYIAANASFSYVIFTGNKVNGGTMPVAATNYIVDNNLT